jgi:centrin-1
LDKDKGGSISAEELEEPLIALGFAESREDVQTLINAIDKNGNGEIELEEFLTIIKSGKVEGGLKCSKGQAGRRSASSSKR